MEMLKMAIAPPNNRTHGHNIEEFRWLLGRIPRELGGKIVSLEELKKLFPQTDKFWRATLSEEHEYYNVFSRPRKDDRERRAPVAYECKACDNIIVGPPRIESVEPARHFAETMETREIYCTNPECNHNLEGDIMDRMDKYRKG